jgi:hypothetical protein
VPTGWAQEQIRVCLHYPFCLRLLKSKKIQTWYSVDSYFLSKSECVHTYTHRYKCYYHTQLWTWKGWGMSYAFFRLRSKILVASDICAARCGHVRIMMYDVIPNVPTSWTYWNLMNKVNNQSAETKNNTMSLLTQFSANNNLLWGIQIQEGIHYDSFNSKP